MQKRAEAEELVSTGKIITEIEDRTVKLDATQQGNLKLYDDVSR